MKKPVKETTFQKAAVRVLNRVTGCMAVSYYNGGIFSQRLGVFLSKQSDRPAGFPDIIGCFHGKAFAIETKTVKGKLSEAQALMHSKMNRRGWAVRVCREINEVLAFLADIEAGKLGA